MALACHFWLTHGCRSRMGEAMKLGNCRAVRPKGVQCAAHPGTVGCVPGPSLDATYHYEVLGEGAS